MKAILTIGISASGKTTWARNFMYEDTTDNWALICRDDIRFEIMRNKGLYPCWANWKWKWETEVSEIADAQLANAHALGFNVIIGDTNINLKTRTLMENKLIEMGYEIEHKFIEATYDEAVSRDNARENGVGYSVIQKQWQNVLDMNGSRCVQDASLRPAVIVDIDGTVALMEGIRRPFEWDKVDLDKPHTPIIHMVKGLASAGYKILFTSGRDGICLEKTLDWLQVYFDDVSFELFMRAPNDTRKDTIVKHEIFMRDIHPHFNIHVVLDDRPSVCRMWRDLGLNVVQVGNPYVEF